MKRLLSMGIFLVTMLIFAAGVQAYTLTWVSESKDYGVGDTVGGWEVLEYKDAVADNANGVWTTSGYMGGDTRPNGATILWFYYGGSSAATTLGTKSTAVAFMLESDSNDKYVNFYVDGVCVLANYDMMTLPGQIAYPDWQVGTLVVSGLDYDYHTIRIGNVDTSSYRDDFHLYGGAAVAPVPLPAAIWLLGPGLLGVLGIRRKMNQ